jgi:hypothetical protein
MVECTLEASFMVFFVARSNSDGFFLVRTCQKYIDPPTTNEELAARLNAAVTTVDDNMLRHSRECYVVHCCLP